MEDPRDMVLSTCSTLIAIVEFGGSIVVQFSHFSVKGHLISSRVTGELEGRVSRYHIPFEPAPALVTQARLSIRPQLDDEGTHEGIFPC